MNVLLCRSDVRFFIPEKENQFVFEILLYLIIFEKKGKEDNKISGK